MEVKDLLEKADLKFAAVNGPEYTVFLPPGPLSEENLLGGPLTCYSWEMVAACTCLGRLRESLGKEPVFSTEEAQAMTIMIGSHRMMKTCEMHGLVENAGTDTYGMGPYKKKDVANG